MNYVGVQIKEFSAWEDTQLKLMNIFLQSDNIEVVDILATPATHERFGFNYVMYSIIYREKRR